MDPKSAIKILRDTLEYVIQVRRIECAHATPAPDEVCARCRAEMALKATQPFRRRTHNERWEEP